MTSSMKIVLPLLLLGIILSFVAVHYLSSKSKYTDNVENIDRQVLRYRRAVQSNVQYCRLNHFYDEDKGRCLSVPGGGRILHVEKERSCGINIMKSHCTSPLYYHICTHGRSILAQCESGQIFDSRLQRCITSRQFPDHNKHYDPNSVPDCAKPGRFSVPGHCSVFYTCNRRGRQLYRSVYKCPRNTGYYADKGTCAVMPGCQNDDSVDYAVCVPDSSSDEKLQSRSLAEAAEKDVERTSETPIEHRAVSVSDHTVKTTEEPKLEERRNVSPEIDDRTVFTTPVSTMDNPQLVDNKKDSDNGMGNASTQPIEDASVPGNVESLYKLYAPIDKTDEFSISPETTISPSESSDKADPTMDISSRMVNDEQQENVTSYEGSGDVSSDSSLSYTTDPSFVSSQFDSTTEAIAHDSSSAAGEMDQAYDTSFVEIPETTQLPMEDISVADNADETSTVETSDSAETTQQILAKDQSSMWVTIVPSTTELDDDASHFVMSAIPTTEYSTNVDVDTNVDAATNDTPLLSSVSYTSGELEETHAATTAEYENDHEYEMSTSSSVETTDQGPMTLNDTSTIVSDPNSDDSDTLSSTSIPDATFSEPLTDIESHTENTLMFETSTLAEGEFADISPRLLTSDPDENVSDSTRGRSLLEHADEPYLGSATTTLIPRYASLDTTTVGTIQDLPTTSDANSFTQNDEDIAEGITEVPLTSSAD